MALVSISECITEKVNVQPKAKTGPIRDLGNISVTLCSKTIHVNEREETSRVT